MALNFQTLKTRALTALIFVIVMLGGLLWNYQAFLVLFTIIHFGCWYEFIKLLRKINSKNNLVYSLPGLIYISLPIIAMIGLGIKWEISSIDNTNRFVFTNIVPCAILFSIWINDTMAYLVGSLIGKTPFSKISPKKTLEGTIGGIILCVVTISLVAYFSKILPVQHAGAIAAICGIFGTAGDLLESKIKRMADVKDSGSFMPGHGGFLDRFDSLLVATPFVWIYVHFFI